MRIINHKVNKNDKKSNNNYKIKQNLILRKLQIIIVKYVT